MAGRCGLATTACRRHDPRRHLGQHFSVACKIAAETDDRNRQTRSSVHKTQRRAAENQLHEQQRQAEQWVSGNATTKPPKVCSGVHTFHHGHYEYPVQQRAQEMAMTGRSGRTTTACRRHDPRRHLGQHVTAACKIVAQTDRRAAACTKRSGVQQKISSTSNRGRRSNG